MRAPFLSESEGFHFVLLTVAAFTAIAVASLVGGVWAGVPVWAAVTGGALVFYARRRSESAPRPLEGAPAADGPAKERRVLVVALGQLGEEALDLIRPASRAAPAHVLVVHPTPVSAVHHWTSDVDAARARAERALEENLTLLRERGVAARGKVGDEDTVQSIEDALRIFAASEILLWAGPAPGSPATRERPALRAMHA